MTRIIDSDGLLGRHTTPTHVFPSHVFPSHLFPSHVFPSHVLRRYISRIYSQENDGLVARAVRGNGRAGKSLERKAQGKRWRKIGREKLQESDGREMGEESCRKACWPCMDGGKRGTASTPQLRRAASASRNCEALLLTAIATRRSPDSVPGLRCTNFRVPGSSCRISPTARCCA